MKNTKISCYLLGDDFAHLVIQSWTITDHLPFLGFDQYTCFCKY